MPGIGSGGFPPSGQSATAGRQYAYGPFGYYVPIDQSDFVSYGTSLPTYQVCGVAGSFSVGGFSAASTIKVDHVSSSGEWFRIHDPAASHDFLVLMHFTKSSDFTNQFANNGDGSFSFF